MMTFRFDHLFFATAGLLALAGCQSNQAATPSQMQQMSAVCQSYGFKEGTDPFAMCMMQLDRARAENETRRRIAAADALGAVGAQMQQNAAAMRPVTCTSNRFGNTVTTNCY